MAKECLYFSSSPDNPDIREVLGLFSNDINKAVKEFFVFSKGEDAEEYLDIENESTSKISEERVMDYIMNYLDKNRMTISDLIKPEYGKIRDRLLWDLTEYTHLSKRKIAGITGLNRETVRKVMLLREPSRRHRMDTHE